MLACNTCGKSVKDRNSIKYNLCLTKVHRKCNYLNYGDSQYIKFSNKTLCCYKCNKDLLQFKTISNFSLYSLPSGRFYCNSDSNESCLTLKPPKNLSHLMNLIPSPLISIIKFSTFPLVSDYSFYRFCWQ